MKAHLCMSCDHWYEDVADGLLCEEGYRPRFYKMPYKIGNQIGTIEVPKRRCKAYKPFSEAKDESISTI